MPGIEAFTESEIRAVLNCHSPGNEGHCLCAWGIGADSSIEFTTEHFIEQLSKHHKGV